MQYLLTRGLADEGKGGGARATNMIYTNMLFALGLDRVVFGVVPGWWSLCGSGLILGSAVFVAVGKQGDGDGDGDEERVVGVEVSEEGEEMGILMMSGVRGRVEEREETDERVQAEEMRLLGGEEALGEEGEAGAGLHRVNEAENRGVELS